MTINDCFKIGYILKPHGLKGEVTLSLDPAYSAVEDSIDTVFMERDNRVVPYFVERMSIRGPRAFLKLEGVDTPDAAASISKCSVFLPKSARQRAGRGEFYDDEIVGFEVVDQRAGFLGAVTGVLQAGGNRLLSIEGGKEVLIPLNSPFIKSVNKAKKRIAVDLPDGFLDI